MVVRKASIEDLDALYENRMHFTQIMRNYEITLTEEFKQNSYAYMKEHIANDTFAAWIIEEDGIVASTAMVSYYQKMPMVSNPSGICGYILNVYTHPDYRRKGYASLLLQTIIDDAKERNVGVLNLLASDMGRPVYEKLGFLPLTNDMSYRLV